MDNDSDSDFSIIEKEEIDNTSNRNEPTTENKSIKNQIIKTTSFKRATTHDSNTSLDENFSHVITTKVNSEIIRQSLDKRELIHALKPFMFDTLKRCHRLEDIKSNIWDVLINETDPLWSIDERDLLCGLIDSVNSFSKPKLGVLIAKNDYPFPLVFSKYDFQIDQVVSEYCFELFDDILCMTSRPLALVLGTKNAAFMGKSALIPVFFEGLHEKRSVFRSRLNEPEFMSDNVDVICSEEYGNKWIVADFHSSVESIGVKNLLKAFSLFSSLVILNTTVEDFDKSGKVSLELVSYLDSFNEKTARNIILLVRDFKQTDKNRFDVIKNNMESSYKSMKIHILTVENISADSPLVSKKRNLLQKNVFDIIEKIEKTPMGSLKNVETAFNCLNKGENIEALDFENKIQRRFRELFSDQNEEFLKNIFPIARKNARIKKLQDSMNRAGYEDSSQRKLGEDRLRSLKQEISELQPINDYIKFFIEIVLGDNFVKDLIVFEACLIEFKKEILKSLRNERNEKRNRFAELDQSLKKYKVKYETGELESDHKIIDIVADLKSLKKAINDLDEKIEIFDLTVDKFWDEVFSIYDWILEKESGTSPISEPNTKQEVSVFKSNVNSFIDRFLVLVKYGFSIHILRGQPLKLESKMLELIFDRLKQKQDTLIITVIGEQSSAKSSLLNALFGCDFRTSAGRCTLGIYMNFATYKDKLIVILDTEGLMSVEAGSYVLDNQLATMAILSSHLIVINHKGEISSNLERLLGITFYAKMQTGSSKFKPLVVFVLRDQIERREDNYQNQASQLKNKLIEKARYIHISVDDIMNIDVNDVFLLPSAFAEDNGMKWRNSDFPAQVFELRKKLLQKLEQMNTEGHTFQDPAKLYSSMKSYWSMLIDLGDGILTCKDLEEIKVRREIAAKFEKLSETYLNSFKDQCLDITDKGKEKLNSISRQSEATNDAESVETAKNESNRVNLDINQKLNAEFESFYQKVSQEFNNEIKLLDFPEDIKREYQGKIKTHFERIKSMALFDWNTYLTNALETNAIENAKHELVAKVSSLLMSDSDLHNFDRLVEDRIQDCTEKYNTHLEKKFPSDEQYRRDIEERFNNNHLHHVFSKDKLSMVSRLVDFEGYVNNCQADNNCLFSIDKWLKDKHKQQITDFVLKAIIWMKHFKNKKKKKNISSFEIEEVIEWIGCTCYEIVPSLVEQIKKPYVEDAHIRNALRVINHSFFQQDSPIVKFESKFQMNELISNILRFAFYEMWKYYVTLKEKDVAENKTKFEEMINVLKQHIQSSKDSMKDCKELGETVGKLVVMSLETILVAKSDENAKNQITRKIFDILQNPEKIVEQAFNMSFKAFDYVAVYKYVTNTVKYCTEVGNQIVQEPVRTIIINEKNDLKGSFNKFLQVFSTFGSNFRKDSNNQSSIYAVIDQVIEYLTDEKLKSSLIDAKKSIIDCRIDKIDYFIGSFFDSVIVNLTECVNKIQLLDEKLEKMAMKHANITLVQIIGCKNCCPGCGSKCNLEAGHNGPHKSCYHVYNGFNGWCDLETNEVRTNLCWEEKFYINANNHVKELDENGNTHRVCYKGLQQYLEKKHPNWLADVRENNIKYGQNSTEANMRAFKEYEYWMKRCWINVKEPILKNKNMIDKRYDDAWLREIEDNRKLPSDFKIDGY